MNIFKIITIGEVDSTNNYARGLVSRKEAEEGTVVLAQYQTNGHGVGSNYWESENGKNLTFSLLLKPLFIDSTRQFFLSMAISLGIIDFIADEVKQVKIKWPNDIYVSEKKIGGILIENTITGNRISDSIVGIGININQEKFVSDAPNPVSLKELTGQEYDLGSCLDIVYSNIFRWYDLLRTGKFDTISEAYISSMFRFNEWATFKTQDGKFRGRIIGIDDFGQLKIETTENQIRLFQFKEVEYSLIDTEV